MAIPKEISQLGPLEIRFLQDSDNTDGLLSLFEFIVPRGGAHHFVNNGTETTRTLAMLTPGLIGPAYFREIAALLAAGGSPDPAKVAEVMARHGLVVVTGGA